MKKQLAVAGIIAGISAAGLTGVSIASAATDTSTSNTTSMSSLVDAIASKFNVNKSDVQAVFDEQRTTMEAEREARVKEEVAQLVSDGKLTQSQADKINAKRAELQAEREVNWENASSNTREEITSERDGKRAELETWAKENNISTAYLRYVFGGGRDHGPDGERPPVSDTSDTQLNR